MCRHEKSLNKTENLTATHLTSSRNKPNTTEQTKIGQLVLSLSSNFHRISVNCQPFSKQTVNRQPSTVNRQPSTVKTID
ncbi:MAG: hypothetical protein JGK01_15155 [Microcoleus sp. PH2017_03_ELD_O_A]|nr:hypothetical protein [Microcoleus sp. PH2017_03_ELD_O_A]